MAQIGTFTRTPDGSGFGGAIRTLSLNVKVKIVSEAIKENDNAPDYRVFATNGAELGAAWKKTGERAGEYLSVTIDDPSFARPLYANLIRAESDKDLYMLLWNRPQLKKD